jgi:hypothetical protein
MFINSRLSAGKPSFYVNGRAAFIMPSENAWPCETAGVIAYKFPADVSCKSIAVSCYRFLDVAFPDNLCTAGGNNSFNVNITIYRFAVVGKPFSARLSSLLLFVISQLDTLCPVFLSLLLLDRALLGLDSLIDLPLLDPCLLVLLPLSLFDRALFCSRLLLNGFLLLFYFTLFRSHLLFGLSLLDPRLLSRSSFFTFSKSSTGK